MPRIAYRTIRSRRKFSEAPEVIRRLGLVLDDEVKPHFIQAFERVVANWKHKPQFKARKFIRPDRMRVDIFPAGENKDIWKFVTGGTRAHPIPLSPKTVGTLAFLWGGPGSYKPKTKPLGKFGGPGTVSGGVMHFPKQVQHPGTKPRNFEKNIKEDNREWFSNTMENAWRRIIRSL